MGVDDKAENAGEKIVGKVKEVFGKVTGDEKTEAEGETQQTKGQLGDAVENVKDAFK